MAVVTALPFLSVILTPLAESAGGVTETCPALVRTVTGPTRLPELPDTATGSRARDALGSAVSVADFCSQSASLSAWSSDAVTSALSE